MEREAARQYLPETNRTTTRRPGEQRGEGGRAAGEAKGAAGTRCSGLDLHTNGSDGGSKQTSVNYVGVVFPMMD